IAAAVAAQGGADRTAVVYAAASAGAAPDLAEAAESPAEETAELTLRNDVGLHARPAALLARTLADVDAEVRVRLGDSEVDARSVLGLMSLGARQGDTLHLDARGAQAAEAIRRAKELVETNFGE
ncbi:HPr family phosphocarrier protein, partial [Amycolatopsis magusensis]